VLPGLFAYQSVYELTVRPSTAWLLAKAIRVSDSVSKS